MATLKQVQLRLRLAKKKLTTLNKEVIATKSKIKKLDAELKKAKAAAKAATAKKKKPVAKKKPVVKKKPVAKKKAPAKKKVASKKK
jgi:colicin import membrane protein